MIFEKPASTRMLLGRGDRQAIAWCCLPEGSLNSWINKLPPWQQCRSSVLVIYPASRRSYGIQPA